MASRRQHPWIRGNPWPELTWVDRAPFIWRLRSARCRFLERREIRLAFGDFHLDDLEPDSPPATTVEVEEARPAREAARPLGRRRLADGAELLRGGDGSTARPAYRDEGRRP